MNIALDIGISRVLHVDYKDEYKEFCDIIYGKYPGNRQNLLVLAWAGMEPDLIKDNKLRSLYKKIWWTDKPPAPIAIYYMLLENGISTIEVGELGNVNPFGSFREGGQENNTRQMPSGDLADIGTEPDKYERKALKDRQNTGASGDFSNAVSEWFKTIQIEKSEFGTSDIEDFLSRIEITDTIDQVSTRITSAITSNTQVQFYPYRLTRAGFVYLNIGISDLLHRYYNLTSERRKPRLNIYVDTSPSMYFFKERQVFLIERFRDLFPTTFYVFAGNVKEFLIDDFIHGRYSMGYSTSFDSVIIMGKPPALLGVYQSLTFTGK